MNEHDDLGAPVNPGEGMGFVSRGKARPVGDADTGGFSVELARTNNPVVRDAYAPEIERQERADARQAVQLERANAAAAREAKAVADAERKRRLSDTEADFRSKGVKFFTDAEGNMRPVTDTQGRTLYNETPWRKGGDAERGFWQERRDGFGKTQRRKPKLKAGADASDPNLYYDFGDEGDEVAGHVDDLVNVKDPEVAAAASKARARRNAELRKASLAPLSQARESAEADMQRAQREALAIDEEAAGLQTRIAEIEANPEYGQKAGGVLGFGASPTEAAARLNTQRQVLTDELGRLQTRQAEASMRIDKDGELARRARGAKLDEDIWKSESEAAAYGDLADARRAALKRDGKAIAGDPVLEAIGRKQEELGVARSRTFAERERMRQIASDAEAQARAAELPGMDAIKAEAQRFEADAKAFDEQAARGLFDVEKRDDLVRRQGTLRGQFARIEAEAVQGMKDFENYADGLVRDIETYQADSERWDYSGGVVGGALDRQGERFGKVQKAVAGRSRWVEGFGDTLGFVGGAIGTWTDILTGVSPQGIERKRRAEEAWELVGTFRDKDARRALTARVAAEEAIKADPAAQLVAVPSLEERPFTSAERGRMASGVLDLPTLQRLANGLRETDAGMLDQIGFGTREAVRNLVSLVNVVPGVNLEKMGAPKTPEEFAKWRVLRGEVAKLAAEKFGIAEASGMVAGSVGQFMLTRKVAGGMTARVADMAGKASLGVRLSAVAANAERNANWLTYGTVGTASSFTENPESLGFFNRFVSAGMQSLGLGVAESTGNRLEALAGKFAKVKRGYGNLTKRELAGVAGGTAGEFTSEWVESAVLNQDFTPAVPVAFWGGLGAVLGMRMFGAAGRVRAQRDYTRFAETAAAAKNEAFNRWGDVKAFMASPEGKRVAELLPAELTEGGDDLARRVFANDAENTQAEMHDAGRALTQDFGLTVGFGQFIQGVQARMARSRAAMGEIDAMPDFAQTDPATGAPVVDPALRNVNRDAARALVRVTNGVRLSDLTEAQAQAVEVIGQQLGTQVFRDVGGVPVITDKASSWLGDQSPAAASLIGASEAEMISRATAQEPTREATGGNPAVVVAEDADGSPAPDLSGGVESRNAATMTGNPKGQIPAQSNVAPDAGVAPGPLNQSPGTVDFTDSRGTARSVDVPAGAVVPSTGAPVRDTASARRWLAETAGESVRGVSFRAASGESAPASGELLGANQTSAVFRRASASRKVSAQDRPALARRVVAARRGLAASLEKWGSVFPGGVRVVDDAAGSGGVYFDAKTDALVVSLADVADQLETLTEDPSRIDALVTEEAIHRAAVEVERGGAWDATQLWGSLAPATQTAVRRVYDPAGKLQPSDWQLGHELVRLLVQGRINLRGDGGVNLDGKLVSEATASRGFVAQMRDALAAIGEYLRDLAGRLRADGNAAETVAAVEQAVALVESRINELSGARPDGEAARNTPRREGESTTPAPAVPSVQPVPAQAVDVPSEGESLGGARAGETGPRARLVVGEDGRLAPASLAALARELGVTPDRIGLVEPVSNNGETFWTANVAIEADAANTSHLPDGRINPGYPQTLQPRDRAGAQYLAQQRRIAGRPNMREEALTGTADHGTPIMALVDGRAVTVMGNGRANAKALMYADADFADAVATFRAGLPAVAGRKGIAAESVASLRQPVLARVVLTPLSVDALRNVSQDSNRAAGAATNAVEQGRIDAERLGADTLALFKPAFRIDGRENADFRAAFVRSVLRSGEENTTGADLVRRIEQAVFLRAYGGTAEGAAAFERMTGERDDAGVRNLVDGMLELAPEVSVARAKMEQGTLHPLDLSGSIASAVQRIGVALRDKPRNQRVDVALDALVSQGSLLADDGVGDEVLAFFVANRRDKARLTQGVRDFYALAYAAGNPAQTTLFEDAAPDVAMLWREATAQAPEGALLSSVPPSIAATLNERLLSGPVQTRYATSEYEYLGDPSEDWRASSHPEAGIVNPIDPSLDADAKVDALRELTRANVPVVRQILADLDKIGLSGKYSEKLPERIQAKASRPSIRAEKPWHAIEHVRDALRFKVGLVHFNKVPQIVQVLRRNGVEVIKFDHKKMFGPKGFGWRFVAWDMRMPNGQLVEFYAPVPEMDNKAVKGPNHHLFENWRNVSAETIAANAEMQHAYKADLRLSRERYDAAFMAAMRRMGYADLAAAEAAWNRSVALAESVTKENFSIASTADIAPGAQAPSRDLRIENESAKTTASPSSDSYASTPGGDDFAVEGALDSDGFINNTSTENGPSEQQENGENRLLAGRGQSRADGTGDFFDLLGAGDAADALVRSLPPATRAKPNAVKLAAKKAVPGLKKDGLDALAARAGRIEAELELWGDLAPASSGEENQLSEPAPDRMGSGDEDSAPAARTRNPRPRNRGQVGGTGGVGNDLGALPLFESGDAVGGAGQESAGPAPDAGGQNDGAESGVGEAVARGGPGYDGPVAGVSGGGLSDSLSRDGLGAARALARERGASGRLLRRAEYLKLPPELQNYRIEGDEIAPRGQRAKLRANLDALRLLRALEAENRAATPAEKDTLARFVGWGALSQVFDDSKGGSVERGDMDALRETAERLERQGRMYGASASNYYVDEAKKARDRLTALENWDKQYGDGYRELKNLLTPEEWERAMRSTLNAHYTSPAVIRAMWSALERMGFKGGRVLEPAGGVGHFFGAMPEGMMQASELSGVELDSVTGRILGKLYPQANVQVTGFQDARIPNASQDLVISNVPFARTGPRDASLSDAPNFNLHNYFFAKALQKAKPGGLVAFITTHHTMDSSAGQRAWLAQRAEFVGAMRLPKTAFKDNASTEVVTDVIFLRKPDGGMPPFAADSWADVREVAREGDTPIVINEYFQRNPEMVLGRNALTGSMYRENEYTVEPTGDLSAQMAAAIERLPENIHERGDAATATNDPEAMLADRDRRSGNFVERDGVLFRVDGVELKPVESLPDFAPVEGDDNKAKAARTRQAKLVRRLRSWLPLRDHYRQHLALMQNATASEEQIEASRERLNLLYDQVRAVDSGKYPLSHSAWNGLRSDPDFYLTLGLEVPVQQEDGLRTYRKADVFNRRTVIPPSAPSRASSPADAVRISQAWKGRVDSEYVADLLGMEQGEAEQRLIADGLAFRDPETGLLEDREAYLSGYVRAKLAAAKIAADNDPAYAGNVAALEAVQPPPVTLSDITVRLGVSWLPSDVVTRFAQDDLQLGAEATVARSGERVRWGMRELRSGARFNSANSRTWAGGGWTGLEIMEAVLNGRPIQSFKTEGTGKDAKRVIDPVATAQAQDVAERMRRRFTDWVKTPDRMIEVRVGEFTQPRPIREIVERGYNDSFNGYRERVWDGSHLTLPGAAPHVLGAENKGGLRAHQKAAIWRAVTEGHAFLAHAPGFGKTNVFIAIAMEWRRLGVAKKPMIVVQNATLEQFAASFRRMYPAANVLVASKDDLSKDNRKAFTARIAASDWDAVIVAHSQFALIPSDPQTEAAQIRILRDDMQTALNSRMDELRDDRVSAKEIERDPSVKDIAKQLEAIEKRLSAVAERKQDDVVNFGEMGIDALLIDEAHYFKKVPFATQLERIAGLDRGASQRAFDTLVKARGIQDKRDGRGVVLGTGTPITNTMAEIWNMLRLSAPKLLKRFGVEAFDDFIKTFGSVEKSVEMNAVGKFVERQRLKRFVNGGGLAQMVRAGMDVQMDASKVTLNRPNVDVEPVVVGRSDQVGAYIERLVSIYEKWAALDGEQKQQWSAVPVVLAGLGKAASLDYQLVDPNAADDPGSKVNAMVPVVVRHYRDQAEHKGTQLIFADSYRSVRTDYIDSFEGGGSAVIEADDGTGDETTGDEDSGTPEAASGEERNLYHKIKDKLVAAGIPADAVAVISDFDTGPKREALFAKVNSGDVRVLIGSTFKMGVGVNVQERLYALHHLDAPWTPADLDQRNARSERDGNRYYDWGESIKRHTYAMADTLDAGRFQLLETKGKFARQAMEGKMGVEFDDPAGGIVDEAAQMKALAAGNPLVLTQVELTNRVRELDIGRQAWLRTREEHAATLERARKNVADASETVGRVSQHRDELQALAEANPLANPAALVAEIDTRIKTGAKQIEEDGAFALGEGPGREVFARDLNGLRVSITVRGIVEEVNEGGERKQRMGWRATAYAHRGTTALRSAEVKTGGGRRVLQLLEDVRADARRDAERATDVLERYRGDLAAIERETGGDWEMASEHERAQRALTAVNAAIADNKTQLAPEDAALLSAPGQMVLDFAPASAPETDRASLVRDNVNLADSIARRFKVRGVEADDLRGEARLALVRAAKAYDPTKGGFRSFAGVAIRNALRDRFQEGKRAPRSESMSEPVGEGGIVRGDTLGADETIRAAAERSESFALLNAAVDALPPRPRMVVRLYMEGRHFRMIGAEMGFTGEYARQIFNNAMHVIRARLRRDGVEGMVDDVLFSGRDNSEGDAEEVSRLLGELTRSAPVESMRDMHARAEAEMPGAQTIGRPDLANPAQGDARRVVDAVDAARAAEAERETQERWRDEAQSIVANDRAGVLRDLLERSRRGDVLADPVQVKAAQILVADLTAEAVRTRDPQTMRDAQLLAYAYREQGTEQARAMAARHDPHKRPAERYKEFLAGALFAPTPAIRKAMRGAWSPAEKSRAVDELRRKLSDAQSRVAVAPPATKAKVEAEAARLRVELGRALQRKDSVETMNSALSERLAKIETEIGKMGVTLDDVFNGEAYLRLRGAKIIGAVADRAGFNEAKRRALKLIQNGWNNAEVAKRTGLTADQVAGVEAEMVAKLKERLRTLGDAALDVNKFDTDSLFAGPGDASQGSGLSAAEREARIEEIVRAMGFNRSAERDTRTRRARARRPRGERPARTPSSLPPADDATLDEVRRTRPRGSQAEFGDPNPRPAPSPELPDTGGPRAELENPTIERGPGTTPDYPTSATGRPDTSGGNRQMALGEDAELAPPVFDIADPVHVTQLARIIQATDANAFDMAFEFWVNSVLSGPLTQGANIVGNTANALWDFGPKRFGEAAVNAALGNRPDMPQMGEYRHMMRAASPAISRAWNNAMRSWAGESPFFDADVLDAQLSLGIEDKTGGVKAAIGGKLGRVVRIPGRLLMATDDFFKTVVGQLEATGQAYRIAKSEGLAGAAFESRIAGLVNTPGSPAWSAAVEKAKELTFQSENEGNAVGSVTKSISRLRETDFGGGVRPLRFILPFIRTPMNIFQQGLRQSPVGSATMALRLARAGFYRIKDGKPVLASYPAAQLAKHAVEQAFAWTLAGLLFVGAAGDDDDEDKPFFITGGLDAETAGLRELDQRTGLKPYSIRVGGVTVSYGRIEPMAVAVGATVDAISQWKRAQRTGDFSFIGALLDGVTKQTEDKTFLRGIGDLMAAVRDTRGGERESYAANFLASWIPNILRQPIRQLDGKVRDARGAGFGESLLGRVVPQTLPARVDAMGEEVEKGGFTPWRTSIPIEITSAPDVARVDRLLRNYAQANPDDAWAPAPVGRRVVVGGVPRELTSEEKHTYAVESGKLAARLLASSPLNVDKPTAADIDRVKKAFTVARANAKRRLFGE